MSKNLVDSNWGILPAPKDESIEQKSSRLAAEALAREISQRIDEEISRERSAVKRGKKPVKVLVLGQSESGKSTTIKNFQIGYSYRAWQEERASWAPVVRLNMVRQTNDLVDLLEAEVTAPSTRFKFTERHRIFLHRLVPLRQVQARLEEQLGDPGTSSAVCPETPGGRRRELSVSPRSSWKKLLGGKVKKRGAARSEDDELAEVIVDCRGAIKAIVNDDTMQAILKYRGIHIEDASGFFLADDDVDRIAAPDYSPSDMDVIRARLPTTGVQEYHFSLENGLDVGRPWILYDVGGARTARAAWLPFFDTVDAIIFLSPLNVFDMKLVEDPEINRLEDCFMLWRAICSSPLLTRVQLVLLLNKVDLLRRKVSPRGGKVMIRDAMPTYGSRANDYRTAMTFFRSIFHEIQIKHSPEKRDFVAHFVTVVDTKATTKTLETIQESITRRLLSEHHLI